MMKITKIDSHALAGAFAALLMLSPVVASAAVAEGDILGTSEMEIRAALERKGYEVTEIEIEDGVIEAEFIAQGTEMEIEVDSTTGQVLDVDDD